MPGPHGGRWVPTEEWLQEWKRRLPLQTLLTLVEWLAPKVEAECTAKDMVDQNEVVGYLQQTTMVGLLPVPHPIIIRTFQSNAYTAMWFTSYMWGVIFTRSQSLPLYDWKMIKLIMINR